MLSTFSHVSCILYARNFMLLACQSHLLKSLQLGGLDTIAGSPCVHLFLFLNIRFPSTSHLHPIAPGCKCFVFTEMRESSQIVAEYPNTGYKKGTRWSWVQRFWIDLDLTGHETKLKMKQKNYQEEYILPKQEAQCINLSEGLKFLLDEIPLLISLIRI